MGWLHVPSCPIFKGKITKFYTNEYFELSVKNG